VDLHPSFLWGFLLEIEVARHRPRMLASMVEIDNLDSPRFRKSGMPGFSLGIRLCCPRLIRLPDVFQHTADPRFDFGKQLRFHSGIV
jgi:hypothetical protein